MHFDMLVLLVGTAFCLSSSSLLAQNAASTNASATAQQRLMQDCLSRANGMPTQDRREFMKSCLSAGPSTSPSKSTSTQPASNLEADCKLPTNGQHAKVPAISEWTYHKARRVLLSNGWQPLQTWQTTAGAYDKSQHFGSEVEFWNRGYREIESCSGTGEANCSFLFNDVYKNKLRVVTRGEEIPSEKAFATVNSFRFVCR